VKARNLDLSRRFEKPAYSAYAVVREVEIFVPMDRSGWKRKTNGFKKRLESRKDTLRRPKAVE